MDSAPKRAKQKRRSVPAIAESFLVIFWCSVVDKRAVIGGSDALAGGNGISFLHMFPIWCLVSFIIPQDRTHSKDL